MITQEFINNLLQIPLYALGIALMLGIMRYKALIPLQRRLLILLVITAVTELISKILWYQSTNNSFIFHFYAVAEFWILSGIYQIKLNDIIKSSLMTYLRYSFILLAILNTVWLQGLDQFNSNTITLSSVLLIIMSILYFYQLLKETRYVSLERNPMFWINVGVLIYFSSSLMLFHTSHMLIPESLQVWGAAWGIHAIFNVFHYLAFAAALWVTPQK